MFVLCIDLSGKTIHLYNTTVLELFQHIYGAPNNFTKISIARCSMGVMKITEAL